MCVCKDGNTSVFCSGATCLLLELVLDFLVTSGAHYRVESGALVDNFDSVQCTVLPTSSLEHGLRFL